MEYGTGRVEETANLPDLALEYETMVEPFTRQIARAALDMAAEVGLGKKVLDVAAGTGALSVLAAEAGAQVLGIDISPEMVARLSTRLAPYPGCSAAMMDGQALQVADGAFDAAFSILGVIAFPDFRKGLRELARSTRPNGLGCIATMTDPRGIGPLLLFTEAVRAAFPDRAPFPMHGGLAKLSSRPMVEAEMAEAGFHDIEQREVVATWIGPSVDEFMARQTKMLRFTPPYAAMAGTDRERLQPALREACERYEVDGLIRMSPTFLVAVARRF